MEFKRLVKTELKFDEKEKAIIDNFIHSIINEISVCCDKIITNCRECPFKGMCSITINNAEDVENMINSNCHFEKEEE